MDKQFWVSIQQNDYQIPEGYPLLELKEALLATIGSPDPELRDKIGLEVFWNWLVNGHYSLDDLNRLIPHLTDNLKVGIGESDSDSVFLRSFSCLWLSGIVAVDNQQPQLPPEQIRGILEAALAYLPAERDLRGLTPDKGWGHAVAHAGDLFWRLAGSLVTTADDHMRMLDCIRERLNHSDITVFIYHEDCRLAKAVVEIFRRELISFSQFGGWLKALSASWNGAWASEGTTMAYFNTRNFVRCLHWQLDTVEDFTDRKAIMSVLHETLDETKPWVTAA